MKNEYNTSLDFCKCPIKSKDKHIKKQDFIYYSVQNVNTNSQRLLGARFEPLQYFVNGLLSF